VEESPAVPIPSRSPSLRRALAVALAAALVLAGCSDDDSSGDGNGPEETDSVLVDIREATAAAGGMRLEGTLTTADGDEGDVAISVAHEPARGEVALGVSSGALGGTAGHTELRWDGEDLWIRLDDEGAVLEPERPWRTGLYTEQTALVTMPYDPLVLLDSLVAAPVDSVTADQADPDEGGQRRLDIRVVGIPAAATGYGEGALWVDDEDRVTRIRLAGRGRTLEVRVVERGIDVAVTPPGEDEIGTPGGPPAVAEGPWQLVREGRDDATGVTWALERAPGSRGTVCWRLVADPPLESALRTGPQGETCQEPFGPDDEPDDQALFLVDSSGATPYDALVLLVPAGSQATVVDLAGTQQPLAVDEDGFAFWFAPRDAFAVAMVVVLPDGFEIECGPGLITEYSDLDLVPADQRESLLDEGWSCL
jgi:hypothetical protein